MAAKGNTSACVAADLPVLPGEEPWTEEEVAEVRAELTAEVERMRKARDTSDAELANLMGEGIDGAGKDPADVGSSNFERDQELSINANARKLLEQNESALRRLDEGKFGLCENCGSPIGKARLSAFPKATMCVKCKQRQERR
ncbi:TraR/DksA family transcriptional regulator [Propionibacterium sp.]|uniref:TraR/DksA family transcriptional regulator n=1 Tax=Propionibacterium sp. TaxID=1977903 RepID=UPI0039EBF6D7